jgi:hypothetical protein
VQFVALIPMRKCLCTTDDERLAGSTVWRARSATARILIAHLVLIEMGRTMYSSLDHLDACSNFTLVRPTMERQETR